MAKTKRCRPVAGFSFNTPADFCSALGADGHSIAVWARFRGEREHVFRHTLDSTFKDLPFVDALDSESVADFLNDIVAPDPGVFWLGSPGHKNTVHMLTEACRDGVRELAHHPERTVHFYSTIEHLSGAFEGEMPWCPVCFLESIGRVIP